MEKKEKESGKQKMCVRKLATSCLGLRYKTGMKPTNRTGSVSPVTHAAWLPSFPTGKEKTFNPRSQFNL